MWCFFSSRLGTEQRQESWKHGKLSSATDILSRHEQPSRNYCCLRSGPLFTHICCGCFSIQPKYFTLANYQKKKKNPWLRREGLFYFFLYMSRAETMCAFNSYQGKMYKCGDRKCWRSQCGGATVALLSDCIGKLICGLFLQNKWLLLKTATKCYCYATSAMAVTLLCTLQSCAK